MSNFIVPQRWRKGHVRMKHVRVSRDTRRKSPQQRVYGQALLCFVSMAFNTERSDGSQETLPLEGVLIVYRQPCPDYKDCPFYLGYSVLEKALLFWRVHQEARLEAHKHKRDSKSFQTTWVSRWLGNGHLPFLRTGNRYPRISQRGHSCSQWPRGGNSGSFVLGANEMVINDHCFGFGCIPKWQNITTSMKLCWT